MDRLEEIIQHKWAEIQERIRPVREGELTRFAEQKRATSFAAALAHPQRLCVIAEMKRRSPSAGTIAQGACVEERVRDYYNAGADALSILTDERFFGGHLRDLWTATDWMAAREDPRPCLRKDFMLHPIQILEAAEAGAQAILLIVRALDDEAVKVLYEMARLAGLDALFEVHNEREVDRALALGAHIIGINNRDLAHFTTDLGLSEQLLPKIPSDLVRVSESGIHSPEDAQRVRAAGADAVLIGEALMRTENKAAFIQAIQGSDEG